MAKAKKYKPTLGEIFSLSQTGDPRAAPAANMSLAEPMQMPTQPQLQQMQVSPDFAGPQQTAMDNSANVEAVGQAQDAFAARGMALPPSAWNSVGSVEQFMPQVASAALKSADPRKSYWEMSRENNAKNSAKNAVTENQYLDPEAYKRLEQQAKGVNPDTGEIDADNPYQMQDRGIASTEQMLHDYAENTPTPLDLSPLFGILNMHRQDRGKAPVMYKAPTAYRETAKELIGAQKDLQTQRANMAKEVRESIKGMKSGSTSNIIEQLLASKLAMEQGEKPLGWQPGLGAGARAATSDLRIKEKDVRDRINKTMEPLEQRYEQLRTMKSALDSGDYTQLGSILSIASKNIGAESGVLTDRDIQRTLPKTIATDIAGLEAYFSNNKDVKLDPSVTAGMRKLVTIAMKNSHDRYKTALERQVNQYKGSKSFANVDVDDIADPSRQGLNDIAQWQKEMGAGDAPKKGAAGPQPKGSASGLTPEQRRAKIEALKAKQAGK